jgi:hypothetical protein
LTQCQPGGNSEKTHAKSDEGADEVFFQTQSSQTVHLFPPHQPNGKTDIKMQVTEQFHLLREWLARKGSTFEHNPCNGLAQDIATMDLTHAFVPNVAPGKESSSSSVEFWIDDVRHFITSGYPYRYLFRTKSRGNLNANAIPCDTLTTSPAVLGSLSLVPDSDARVVARPQLYHRLDQMEMADIRPRRCLSGPQF